MSQIRFTTPDHDVFTGWDRPLQCHFLVITERGTATAFHPRGGTVVYDHLADPLLTGGDMTVDEVLARLDTHQVPTPPALASVLHLHAAFDAGNTTVHLGTFDGQQWAEAT